MTEKLTNLGPVLSRGLWNVVCVLLVGQEIFQEVFEGHINGYEFILHSH